MYFPAPREGHNAELGIRRPGGCECRGANDHRSAGANCEAKHERYMSHTRVSPNSEVQTIATSMPPEQVEGCATLRADFSDGGQVRLVPTITTRIRAQAAQRPRSSDLQLKDELGTRS